MLDHHEHQRDLNGSSPWTAGLRRLPTDSPRREVSLPGDPSGQRCPCGGRQGGGGSESPTPEGTPFGMIERGQFERRRLRPSIVVETPANDAGLGEVTWVVRALRIRAHRPLNITTTCSRCVRATRPQEQLPRDVEVLRTAARHQHGRVDVYASVLTAGEVRCSDPVGAEEAPHRFRNGARSEGSLPAPQGDSPAASRRLRLLTQMTAP